MIQKVNRKIAGELTGLPTEYLVSHLLEGINSKEALAVLTRRLVEYRAIENKHGVFSIYQQLYGKSFPAEVELAVDVLVDTANFIIRHTLAPLNP